MSFKNKVIWITGASSGIGESLAYALADRGAYLILSSRRKEVLQKVKKQCAGNGDHIHIIPLDLAETKKMSEKAEEALSLYGHIDYLFNNGGISQRSKVIDTRMEVIRRVMEINFFGTVALTKAVLPSMIERKSGHIVVTSSVMGKFGTRQRSVYAASKHALHGYFDCLRQEVYDKNIDVTLLCPGFVKTEVTFNMLKADGRKHGKLGDGQGKGMEPDVFAEKALSQIAKKKQEIYIGGKESWAVYLKRLAPRFLYKILRNTKVT